MFLCAAKYLKYDNRNERGEITNYHVHMENVEKRIIVYVFIDSEHVLTPISFKNDR